MKKILILKGGNDSGKTTKINQVAEWIINTYSIPNTIGLDVMNYRKDTFGILTIGKLIKEKIKDNYIFLVLLKHERRKYHSNLSRCSGNFISC